MSKRIINDELLDVWATMMYEKADAIQEKLEGMDFNSLAYQKLAGMADGIYESLAMLSCLEDGKFVKDYERIKKAIEEEKQQNKNILSMASKKKEELDSMRDW